MFELIILHEKVLSSTKRLIKKNEFELGKSFMKINNRNGPRIYPGWTYFVIGWKSGLTALAVRQKLSEPMQSDPFYTKFL